MTIAEILAGLESERATAQARADACQRAIEMLSLQQPATPAAKRKPQRTRRVAVRRTRQAPRHPGERQVEFKSIRYADVILCHLKRLDTPNNCADSTVLRRVVAKECKVDSGQDTHFRTDIHNALSRLKRDGLIERSGDVWALTEKAKAA